MFMSRLLSPEDFGILSLAQIFSMMISMIMEMGLSSALIQRKELRPAETHAVFTLNIVMVGSLTVVLFALAPLIANFYKSAQLVNAIRLICIQLFFTGIGVVPMALLYREMKFKQIMAATSICASAGSVVAIIMAFKGWGYYALVMQGSISAFLLYFFYLKMSGYKPTVNFKFGESRALFSFSYKIFLSTILNQVFQKIDVLIFGKMYSMSKIGYFNRAVSLDSVIRSFSSSSILNVLLPQISKIQHEPDKIRQLYFKILHLLSFLFFLLGSVIFLNSSYIVEILFGSKWNESALLLQLMLISTFAYPVSSLMLSVIEGSGYASLFLRLEIVKKVLALPFLVLPFFVPMEKYLLSLGLLSYIGVIVNAVGVKKVINVSVAQSMKVVLYYNLLAVLSVGSVYFLMKYLDYGIWGEMIIGASLVTFFYLSFNKVLRTQGFTFAFNELKLRLLKRSTI
jgi:teichuronic acid exporter